MKTEQWKFTGLNLIGYAQIICGKMKRPDTAHFSFVTSTLVTISGLWRGTPEYGRIKVPLSVVLARLKAIGGTKDIESLISTATALMKNHEEMGEVKTAEEIAAIIAPYQTPAATTNEAKA